MATRHVKQLIDDLDGTVLEDGDGSQVTFSVDGRSYEIDLSNSNAEEFRRAFAPYVDAARSIGSAGAGRNRRAASPKSGIDLGAVREWAQANGHSVSDRGRVSASVIDAYTSANN